MPVILKGTHILLLIKDVFSTEIRCFMRKRLKDNPHCLDQLDLETKELIFSRLLDQLPYKTKESLLTRFLENLPYKIVIDSFHRYLTKRGKEGEDNL